jgi:tetratricopeptide (TPR) repeat protein
MLGLACENRGEHKRAEEAHEEAIALFRDADDAWGIGHAAFGLGLVRSRLGDYDGAEAMLTESLSLREGRHTGGTALTLRELGRLALRRGDLRQAHARILASLSLFQEIGGRSGIIGCLEGLAQVALDEGRTLRGVRLLASASALRADEGTPGRPADRTDLDRRLNQARAALDERAFEAAWAEGQAMSLDQAVAYALS